MRAFWAAVVFVCMVETMAAAQQTIQPMSVPEPEIAVATIKPGDPNATDELFTIRGTHIVTVNTPVKDLVKYAYGVNSKQVIGLAESIGKVRFDIDASPDAPGAPNNLQMQAIVRKLLVSRFHLIFHRETREIDVFALKRTNSVPKLEETKRPPDASTDFYGSDGVLNVNNASMQDFATGLSRGLVDRPVVDQTGLKGRYDFVLKWTFLSAASSENPNAPPDLFGAIREELGLKLQATKVPLEVLVIDAIGAPSAN
jgi:uncharacterized protein (TIGR03435 family)